MMVSQNLKRLPASAQPVRGLAARPANSRVSGRRSGNWWGAIGLGAAVALGATALYVHRNARMAEARHPPVGRFLRTDGVLLHYLERGPAPETDAGVSADPRHPVVLLHGIGAMLQDFTASGLVDRLAREHRTIVFDRPGYGYSERPRDRVWTPRNQAALLLHALDQLGIERPIVVGHSWGTLVALAMALDNPQAIHGLVLIAGYYYPTARPEIALALPIALPLVGDIMRHTVAPLIGRMSVERFLAKAFAPHAIPRRFRQDFPIELMLRPSQIAAVAEEIEFLVPAAAGLRRRYGDLSLPVAILAGFDDRIVEPLAQVMPLRRTLPRGELYLLPGQGHMLHYSALDKVGEAIERVARRPTRRPSWSGTIQPTARAP